MTHVQKVMLNLLILILPGWGQNPFSSPEAVIWDAPRERYLVTNYASGQLVSIDVNGNSSVLTDGLTNCLSFDLNGDTAYVSTGSSVRLVDLTDGSIVANIMVPGAGALDGLLYHEGHVYVLATNATIFKIRIADQSVWTWVSGAFPGQPQDMIHDDTNDRMLLCTYNGSSNIWGINPADSTDVYPIIDTEIGGHDGLAMDSAGNLYFSSWSTEAIHMYNSEFVHPPVTVYRASSGAANITIDAVNGKLTLPLFDEDTVLIVDIPNDYAGARFSADPLVGTTPHTVQFTDLSYAAPPATGWLWDMDNNGTVESTESSPLWTFDTPGLYSVSMTVESLHSDTLVMDDLVHVHEAGESGLYFDGQTSLAIVESAAAINPTDAFTIAAWIYPTAWGSDGVYGGGVLSRGSIWFAVSRHASGLDQHTLFLRLAHENGASSFHQAPVTSVWLDNWTHVSVSYDAAAGNVSMYINGEPVTVTTLIPAQGTLADMSANPLTVGSIGETHRFQGVLDEVTIWDRVLDEGSLAGIMVDGIDTEADGLLGAWDMNAGSGSTALDLAGESDLTLSATTWSMGTTNSATGLSGDEQPLLSNSFKLAEGYPNPFNDSLTITFGLEQETQVLIQVFDVLGRRVADLGSSRYSAGRHNVAWQGLDQNGNELNSGIYMVVLTSEGSANTMKTTLLK